MTIDVQRALGAVIGSAVGDALGAPFEFGPAGPYSATFPEPVLGGIGEMTGGGGFGWAPAEFTDDTQMAIVQAESLLDRGGVDGGDLFERFRAWAASARRRRRSRRQRAPSGRPWDRAADEHFRRNPNGGPATARSCGRRRRRSTSRPARSTRRWPRPGDVGGDPRRPRRRLGRRPVPPTGPRRPRRRRPVRRPRRRLSPSSRTTRSRYGTMLGAGVDARLGRPAERHGVDLPRPGGVGGPQHDSFDDAVVAAIDLGGDTDTVAAVTGGLAGAIHGIQAIPSRWTTYLHGAVTTADGTRRVPARRPPRRSPPGCSATPAPDRGTRTAQGSDRDRPGLYAADLGAATDVATDWAVISSVTGRRPLRQPSDPPRGLPHRQGRRPQPRRRRRRRRRDRHDRRLPGRGPPGRSSTATPAPAAPGWSLRAWLMRHPRLGRADRDGAAPRAVAASQHLELGLHLLPPPTADPSVGRARSDDHESGRRGSRSRDCDGGAIWGRPTSSRAST